METLGSPSMITLCTRLPNPIPHRIPGPYGALSFVNTRPMQSNIYKAVASDVVTVSLAGTVITASILAVIWILRSVGAF